MIFEEIFTRLPKLLFIRGIVRCRDYDAFHQKF